MALLYSFQHEIQTPFLILTQVQSFEEHTRIKITRVNLVISCLGESEGNIRVVNREISVNKQQEGE